MSSLAVKIVAPSLGGFELPVTSRALVTIQLNGESKMLLEKPILISLMLILLSACADQAQQTQVAVSPLEFKNYSCKQISKEMAYVSSQLNQASSNSQVDTLVTAGLMAYGMSQGFGMSSGGEDPKIEYLRARYDTLHQVGIQKNCD